MHTPVNPYEVAFRLGAVLLAFGIGIGFVTEITVEEYFVYAGVVTLAVMFVIPYSVVWIGKQMDLYLTDENTEHPPDR